MNDEVDDDLVLDPMPSQFAFHNFNLRNRPQSGKVRPLQSLQGIKQQNKESDQVIQVADNVGPNSLGKLRSSLSSAGYRVNFQQSNQAESADGSKAAAGILQADKAAKQKKP